MDTSNVIALKDNQAGQRIARVVSISGARLVALLDAAVGDDASGGPSAPQIGELVKVVTRGSTAFGIVTGLNNPLPDESRAQRELRITEIELIGEIEHDDGGRPANFQRGVSFYPSLDDIVCRATPSDLHRVFVRPELNTVRIGCLHQDKSVPAFIAPNDLLGKHFAILGATGSGKSCAAAAILRAILRQHGNAHIVILDPHNEYATAFADVAEIITPHNLQLPFWLLNFEELKELVIGEGSRNLESDAAVLNQMVTQAKRNMHQLSAAQGTDQSLLITVDTPVPYRLSDIAKLIDDQLGKLDKPTDFLPYLRVKERLQSLQADGRYSFMFPSGFTLPDNMTKVLSRIFRVPVQGKPVTVIDTSGVPSEVLNVVVSVLCRMAFDFALWGDQAVPILLACEEAHRYAPDSDSGGFASAKRALSRIAKEGRKYGVSLCLISQRPSELATSVISQVSTIFALRLTGEKDQEFLASVLPESSVGLMAELSSLRNGEAIAVGEGVPVPARICLEHLPEHARPKSRTAPFSQAWTHDTVDQQFLEELVARWRRQRY